MAKYLKAFQTQAAYNTYISGNNKILPNVSTCENEVYYNPWDGIIAKYNVTNTNEETKLFLSSTASQFTKMWVDGIEQEDIVYEYTFNTNGEHSVRYELSNPTSISGSTFNGCSNLTKIYLPKALKTIGNYAFKDTTALTEVHIKDLEGWCKVNIQYPNVGTSPLNTAHHLYLNDTELINVIVPYGITSMTRTFWSASYIESVVLPETITILGDYTFNACSSLNSINIPSLVTKIGSMCFDNCNLSSIILPAALTSIGNYAFRNNSHLTNITVLNPTPPTLGNNALLNTGSCPIYVPSESVDTYKAASGWSDHSSRIQAIPSA